MCEWQLGFGGNKRFHATLRVRFREIRTSDCSDCLWHEPADPECPLHGRLWGVIRTLSRHRPRAEFDVVDGARSQQRGAIW